MEKLGKHSGQAESELADLTYLETEQLVRRLKRETDQELIRGAFKEARKRGTLAQPNPIDEDQKKTWKQTCEEERKFVRLPS